MTSKKKNGSACNIKSPLAILSHLQSVIPDMINTIVLILIHLISG